VKRGDGLDLTKMRRRSGDGGAEPLSDELALTLFSFPEPAALLFPGKPSNAQAGPSCAPQFRTPGPRKTLRSSVEMCTPATGVRPRNAPPLMLSEQSPDVSMEMDEGAEAREIDLEAEVEYAGPSARDYGAFLSLLFFLTMI
jgi:hypothetical protein